MRTLPDTNGRIEAATSCRLLLLDAQLSAMNEFADQERAGALRLEISDCKYTPRNHMWLTVKSTNLRGRGDITVYNIEVQRPDTPLIILLHGAYGSHWSWMYSGGIHQTYASLRESSGIISEFVLAMPSDGLTGDATGYLSLASGDYERWIIYDVIETLSRTVNCITPNSRVYLAGVSLGGYGALRLGAKYPHLVSGVSCHSPITALSELDSLIDGPQRMRAHADLQDADVVDWLRRAPPPPLRLDCGDSDPLIMGIRAFHATLDALGVPHQYDEYPGGHDWIYWANRASDSLRFFDRIERDLRAPTTPANGEYSATIKS